MTQDKDKIQQAADALEALGAAPAPDVSGQEPAPEAPAQPPMRTAPVQRRAKAAAAESAPARAEPGPKLTPLTRARRERNIALRRTLIPILLTTGLAMVLLGVWSIAVLLGGSDATGGEVSRYPARLMLLAWPIAVILLAGTAFLMHEVYSHYRIHQAQQPAAEPKRD